MAIRWLKTPFLCDNSTNWCYTFKRFKVPLIPNICALIPSYAVKSYQYADLIGAAAPSCSAVTKCRFSRSWSDWRWSGWR